MMSKKNYFMAAVAAGVLMLASGTAQAETSRLFAGAGVQPDTYDTHLGAEFALNGQQIDLQDGWLLRGQVGWGEYEYSSAVGNVDVDKTSGELLLGYGFAMPGGTAALYAGADYQDHDTEVADPTNSVDGGEGGAKVLAKFKMKPTDRSLVKLAGSYSTVYDSYMASAMAGYGMQYGMIGPEVSFEGNEEDDMWKVGGALSLIDLGFAEAKVSAGYADGGDRRDDGAYGALNLMKTF